MVSKFTFFTDRAVRRIRNTLIDNMTTHGADRSPKYARIATDETRSAAFEAYMLTSLPMDVRRRIGLYACVLHRLDAGWRHINAHIALLNHIVAQSRLMDANRRVFLMDSSLHYGPAYMIAGVLDDPDLVDGIDWSIRSEVRDVFGMPVGDEGDTALAGRAWQVYANGPAPGWFRCPCCRELGPWRRVYEHPGVEMQENEARFLNPNRFPDVENVHPEWLVVRECAHCFHVNEGNPLSWP
jgi:hypothetical protein